ncbi:hypothetical protein BGZ67_008447 [Mortierella alpina]|nr:hypothetical protein BGZ67_008447 [Mortierella alpina]
MVFEESENREQESTYHGADPIYRQRYEASYDEDLAAEFYFDEFNEMRSFDNIFSTSNSNTPVIAEVSRGSSSKKPAETRLEVVSRNSGVGPDDQIWSIETATQRLMELDMGGSRIKPVNSIAIKIGNTQELGQRADTHLAQCQIPIAKKIQFPEKGNIPFVYLLEEIVHEMLRAHQHDMVCPCNTTHTELYWFSGRQSHQENIFDAIARTLGPIIHHWIAAIQNLHCLHLELQHAHLSTLLWNRQRAIVH